MNVCYELLDTLTTPLLDQPGLVERDEHGHITAVDWGTLLRAHTLDNFSSGERSMILLAHDFYSDGRKVPLLELLARVDDTMLAKVVEVMVLQRPGLASRLRLLAR